MIETLKSYWEVILTERSWSWTLIGMIYLVTALIIRSWFLKPLISRAKSLDRHLWHDLKGAYLKHSFLGWLFFLIPLLTVILAWNHHRHQATATVLDLAALIFAVLCYTLSIIFHLQAFAIAAMAALRHTVQETKDKIF